MMRAIFLHEAEIGMMQDEIQGLRQEVASAYEQGWNAGVAEQLEPKE